MVHGIGQRLEKSNLVDDVGNFRHITASLAEQHLTPYQRGTQRVLFIPCQVSDMFSLCVCVCVMTHSVSPRLWSLLQCPPSLKHIVLYETECWAVK